MNTYQQQRDKALHLFDEVVAFSTTQGRADLAQQLHEEAEHLEKGKLVVVVAGEFKQGKSSLVDALLDEPDLFPTSPGIATCLVSTISFGAQEKITIIVGEPGEAESKAIRRDEIRDYVMEQNNKQNFRQARMLTIESPNPRLKDGLVLVDTPGTGGLFKKHSEITYAFLPNADAALYVSDVLSPLSEQDLEFVQKIASHCQHIIFILTKTDQSSESEYKFVMEGNGAKLAKVLNCPGETIRIIPVSSFLKLNYLESQDPEDLQESNFHALEGELWDVLKMRGDILLERALFVLGQALAEIQTPLETEKQALLHNPEIEELKQQLESLQERLRQLESNRSEWRIQLQQGIKSIRDRVYNQLLYDFLEVRKKFETYLDKPELLREPTAMLGLVEQDIYQVMVTLDKDLNAWVTQLRSQIEQTTGLGLNASINTVAAYSKPAIYEREVQQPAKKMGPFSKLMLILSKGRSEATGGELIGLVVGGALGLGVDILAGGTTAGTGLIVGAWLGKQIGTIVGYRTGIARVLEEIKTEELNEARRRIVSEIGTFIEQSKLICSKTIGEAMERLESEMVQEFSRLIEQEKARCTDLLRTISQSQRLSQEEARKELAALSMPLRVAERLEREWQGLAEATVTQAIEPDDDEGDFADV